MNKAHLTDGNSVIITTPVTSIEIPSFDQALTDFTSLKISLCQKVSAYKNTSIANCTETEHCRAFRT